MESFRASLQGRKSESNWSQQLYYSSSSAIAQGMHCEACCEPSGISSPFVPEGIIRVLCSEWHSIGSIFFLR